jgi:hypothetical protein
MRFSCHSQVADFSVLGEKINRKHQSESIEKVTHEKLGKANLNVERYSNDSIFLTMNLFWIG